MLGAVVSSAVVLTAACGPTSEPAQDGSSGDPAATTVPLPSGTTTTDSGMADGTTVTESDDSPAEADSSTATDTGATDVPDDGVRQCDPLRELVPDLLDGDPSNDEPRITETLREMTYGEHGLPGIEGNTFCVAYRGAAGQAISIAGDFNDWEPDEYALEELSQGYYYGVFELPQAPEGLYKLVHTDGEFVADPLARRFGWDKFGEYSQFRAMDDRGHHERWPQFEGGTPDIAARTVSAFVPRGAEQLRDLPVLYLHDGQNVFDPEAVFGGWRTSETLATLIDSGDVPPMILVAIDNSPARFDEYTPYPDLIGGRELGGDAMQYTAWITDMIMPFIEGRYPISLLPEDTAVMGSSLGGLLSLYMGHQRPDLFGYAGSMSGTIDWGSFGLDNPTIDELYAQDPPLGLRIYVDSGGGPGTGCPADGSDNYCGNVRFAETVRGLGWVDDVDLWYAWTPGGLHNEAEWAARFDDALLTWFPG